MRKILFVLALMVGCLKAYAYDFEENGIQYSIVSDSWNPEVVVVGYEYNSSFYLDRQDLYVPSYAYYNGSSYNVVSIQDYAFSNYCYEIRTITLPAGIILGNNVFGGCSNLLSIKTEDYSNLVFWSQGAMAKDGVLYYKEQDNKGKTSVSLYCVPAKKTGKVTIPAFVTEIPQGFDWRTITSVELEEGNDSFVVQNNMLYTSDMKSLLFVPQGYEGELFLSKEVEDLPSFEKTNGITKYVVDPANQKFVSENGVLYTADYSKIIAIPTSYNKTLLIHAETVSIPSDLSGIDNFSIEEGNTRFFTENGVLYEKRKDNQGNERERILAISQSFDGVLKISDIVDNIETTFYSTRNVILYDERVSSIEVSEGNPYYTSIDGVLYNKDCTKLIRIPAAYDKEVQLPETVTEIPSEAMYFCSGYRWKADYSHNTYQTTAQENTSGLFIALGGEDNLQTINTLKIVGTINGYDIMLLNKKMQNVWFLDLSEATIVANDYEFYEGLKTEDNRIPKDCFRGLNNLLELILPNNIVSIGTDFMTGKVTYLDIPSSVTTLKERAFSGDNIIYMTIPETVTNIGSDCFSSNYYLKKLSILSPIESIPGGLCSNCSRLESVEIPNTVVEIGSYAFYDCGSMKHFDFSKITKIGAYAFRYSGLREVEAPNLTTIDRESFSGCKDLALVRMPKLEYTQVYSFSNCSNLILCDIAAVKGIGDFSFIDCTSLPTIYLPNVQRIGAGAFENCSSFTEFTFGEKITQICTSMLNYCCNIKTINWNIVISPRVENHGNDYYSSYYSGRVFDTIKENVSAINFGKNVEIIPSDIFCMPNVTTIAIPSMVRKIENRAFDGCINLTDVYTYTMEPTTISEYTFPNYKTATLHVAEQAYYNYYFGEVWSSFRNLNKEKVDYEDFYLNNDYNSNESTGTVTGTPNVDMGSTSGWIVDTKDQQKVDTVFVKKEDDKSGSIIANDGNLHANQIDVVVKMKKGCWQFFCFPYDIEESENLEYDGTLAIYEYDGLIRATQGNGGWKRVKNGKIHKFKGYIMQGSISGDLHIKFDNVTFAEGNEQVALDFYGGNTPCDDGWNLIGNPYLSYYSIKDLQFDAPILVWDQTNKTYLSVRKSDDDYRLAPFEGFFVQASQKDMHVGFMKDFRQTYLTNNSDNKSALIDDPSRKFINLSFTDGTLTDKTRVVFNESASTVYELGTDMVKMMSQDASAPQIYTINDDINYSINERPMGDACVSLGVKVAKGGAYTFTATRTDGPAILTDKKSGISVDLSEHEYEVSLSAGTYNDRFVLNMNGVVTGIEDITSIAIDLNEIVDMYDISGRLIKRGVAVSEVKKADKGVYILKGASTTHKVNVK